MSIALNLLEDVRWRGRTVAGDRPRALLAALAVGGCRLALFHDGFTLAAAEAVLGSEAIEEVQGLVDQSLLSVRETPAGGRYRMLETVREFGRMRLAEAGEDREARAAQRRWAAGYAHGHGERAAGRDQFAAIDALGAEETNLADELRGAIADGDRCSLVQLLSALGLFWTIRGEHVRLIVLAEAVAEAVGDPHARAAAPGSCLDRDGAVVPFGESLALSAHARYAADGDEAHGRALFLACREHALRMFGAAGTQLDYPAAGHVLFALGAWALTAGPGRGPAYLASDSGVTAMSGLPAAPHQPADHPDQPPRHRQAGRKTRDRPGLRRRARRAGEWGKNKYAGSWAEHLWHRLAAVDFMNQAMLLAATLLLCFVPFLLITAALAGRSAVTALTVRLGLNKQAAADLGHLFTSSSATSNAVTGLSWAFFILAGIAAATAIQRLYQWVFGLDPRGPRDKLRAVLWLALAAGWVAWAPRWRPGSAPARRSCGGSSTSPRSSASGGSRCGSC